jgi:outer membrane protein assembly factor BamB
LKTRSFAGKILSAILILFALGIPFISSTSAIKAGASSIPSTTVFLTPYRIDGTAGQNITVYANITDVTGLLAYQIGLIWSNTTAVECTSVTNGSILNSVPADHSVEIIGTINNTLGKILPYAWSGLGSQYNMNGSGTLAMFTFKMLQTGQADVHVNDMILAYKDGVTVIPCNTVDYFTAVRGGKQYVIRIEGNPMESSSPYGGFGAESVTELSPPKSINGITYQGNVIFQINGTSDDCGPFAYFNATIPNNLMNCTNPDNWIVEFDGVAQTGVLVSTGTENTTISLSTNSDPSFAYSSYSSGKRTLTIEILSNNIAAGAPVDWWPMFHHDLNRTGTSTSTAPTTNSTLWTYTTGSAVESSPAVVGGLVYVGSFDDYVYCLNASTGALAWSYDVGSYVWSSPAVVGGLVYVGSLDDNVYCLNATTGARVWSYTTGGYVWSSPAVVGGLAYVGSEDDNVYCLNAATGAFVWSYKTGGIVYSSPAVVGGLVYVGSFDDYVYCLNAATGAFVWSYTIGGSVESSPAVVGGFVFVGSGDDYVYCLNATIGAFVWSYKTGGYVSSSSAVVGGLVYVGSDDDYVYCLNATIGAFVWSYKTGNLVYSSPAVVGGLVYVGSWDGKVYCLNAATGAFVWSYKTGSYVLSSPAVVNGVVYVGSYDDKIYAFSPRPLTVSISPTSVTLDAGQSHLFNSTVSGGTSPYSYQWYLDGLAVSDATKANWTFASAAVGSYTVYLNVTDTVGVIAISNTTNVTVHAAPFVTISPNSWTMDVGQSKLFTSTVSGGTSPCQFQWYLNGTAEATNSTSWTFTPSSSGFYNVSVSVTDYLDVVAVSKVASVTVNALPSVTISPPSVTLDVGQFQVFTTSVVNGTSPYLIEWYLNGSMVGTNSTSWTYTFSSIGTYTVNVTVTDSVGVVASNAVTVKVNAALVALTVMASPSTVDQGQTSSLTSSPVTTGTSPYTYQWFERAPGGGYAKVGSNLASFSFITSGSTATGSWSFILQVTDNTGAAVNSSAVSVTVNEVPSVSVSPTSWVMDVGQSKLFTSTVSGGTSPCQFQWYLNGVLVSGATSAAYTFAPSSAGVYNVSLVIQDAANYQLTLSLTKITVNNSTLITSFSATPLSSSMLYSNNKASVSLSTSGGSGPYTYEWYLNGVNVGNTTSPSYTYVFSKMGQQRMQVKVTDSAGYLVESSVVSTNYSYNYVPFVLLAVLIIAVIGGVIFFLRRRVPKPSTPKT